ERRVELVIRLTALASQHRFHSRRDLQQAAVGVPGPISINPTGRPSTGNGSEIDMQSSRLPTRGLRSTSPLNSWNAASSSTEDRSGARIFVVGRMKTSFSVKDCSKDRMGPGCRPSRVLIFRALLMLHRALLLACVSQLVPASA